MRKVRWDSAARAVPRRGGSGVSPSTTASSISSREIVVSPASARVTPPARAHRTGALTRGRRPVGVHLDLRFVGALDALRGGALPFVLLRPSAGVAQVQRSPVGIRRCPAMVRLPHGGEPSRLTWVDATSPRRKGGSFDTHRVSDRAHFVLRIPMEDDRNVHQGQAPAPRGIHAVCRRVGLGPHRNVGVGIRAGVPRDRARGQRHRAGHVPSDGDRVAVAHRDRDALRHRRGQPGQGGRRVLGLPAGRPPHEPRRERPQRGGHRRRTNPTWWCCPTNRRAWIRSSASSGSRW